MDQPICYRLSRFPHLTPENFAQRWFYALRDDDKDEFMSIITDPGFQQWGHRHAVDEIFENDALKIAIAVFNGETKRIIDLEDALPDGCTLLNFAAAKGAPRLTKCLIERVDNVDAMSDNERWILKKGFLIDLAIERVCRDQWTTRDSLFELIWRLCYHHRDELEVVRLLVQQTQNTERVKELFMDFADKERLFPFVALFLVAPELFLSSPTSGLSTFNNLYLKLSSLEKRTDIEEGLLLLLDVFAMVGDKLVAYIRLQETSGTVEQTKIEIDFLLREVARKKLGVSSPDYYFRFFKRVRPEATDTISDDDDLPVTWDDFGFGEYGADKPGPWMFGSLKSVLMRKNIDQDYFYRLLPVLESDDSVRLNSAIEKKLSSMSALHGCFKDMTGMSKKGEERVPQGFPSHCGSSFDPNVRLFHTCAASAKPKFDVKFSPTTSWENKVMKPTKLTPFFSARKLSHFSMIAKRLIR